MSDVGMPCRAPVPRESRALPDSHHGEAQRYAGVNAARVRINVVEAPPLRAKAVGGYGSLILARPGTTQVVFTRHIGAPRVRWMTFDVVAGTFHEATGFPGDLRDGVFDGDEAWLLGTHGLCRVSFDPPRVIEIVRSGLGSHQHWLHRLTPTLLAAAVSDGKSAALVDTERRAVVKRVRMPAPDFAIAGDRPRLCAFRAGEARELDVEQLRLGEPIPLPTATSAMNVGRTVVAFVGPLAPWGSLISTDHAVADAILLLLGPAGRLIRRITRTPAAEKPMGHAIRPERFVVVSDDDLSVLYEGGDARGLIKLIGTEPNGRLVATADWGVALVDPESFAVAERIDVPDRGVACWVPEASTAVFLLDYLAEPPPGGFDPVPEKLVLVRW